jgi:hypothetical protein
MPTTTTEAPVTWDWLTTIDATHEAAQLDVIFRAGGPPPEDGPIGDCEGRVLGLFGTRFLGFVDTLVRVGQALGGIGWTGKSFSGDGTGHNRLTRTSRIPMFLAMPRYGLERRGGELIGFHFNHSIEPSPRDPDIVVRGIRYDDPAHANPLMLPRTRDELVELAPGLYLGRALLRDEGEWEIVAYFALREPTTQS